MRYKCICLVGAFLIATLCLLFGLMYYFSQDKCSDGTYSCINSTKCVPYSRWCDGIEDCLHGDDESKKYCFDMKRILQKGKVMEYNMNCDIFITPANCTYINKCSVTCANYINIPQNLPRNIREINLEGNRINEIKPGHLKRFNELRLLILSKNKIATADFSDLDKKEIILINLRHNQLNEFNLKLPRSMLEAIFLEGNCFESITKDLFAGCPNLRVILMQNNNVKDIDEYAFQNLQKLGKIDLDHNKIMRLSPNIFQNIGQLHHLFIGYNPIIEIPKNLFDSINNIRILSVAGISVDNIDKDIFTRLPKLEYIYFEKFHHCMIYAPKTSTCKPFSDGVSSETDLLCKYLLRLAVWSISCITCLGNGLVLWERFTVNDRNRVLSVIIKNLAMSDMLMGIYLFIIAIADIQFRDNYKEEASSWMSSWSCTFLGTLAMISSEVSMLILSLMSVERFILIVNPLGQYCIMTSYATFLSMIIIWVIGIIIAIIPVIYWRDSSTKFYGINGMCFPLYIEDPYFIGWEYSAFIFLGLNFVGLVIIGYVYVNMFVNIWKTRSRTPLSQGDFELALRFFLIVLTDATCWVPIIVLKILAMRKYSVPPHLQAWIVIFIMPVNSAINPLLYTFTTPQFLERFSESWFMKALSYVWRKYSRQDPRETSTGVTSENAIQLAIMRTNSDSDRKGTSSTFNDEKNST